MASNDPIASQARKPALSIEDAERFASQIRPSWELLGPDAAAASFGQDDAPGRGRGPARAPGPRGARAAARKRATGPALGEVGVRGGSRGQDATRSATHLSAGRLRAQQRRGGPSPGPRNAAFLAPARGGDG